MKKIISIVVLCVLASVSASAGPIAIVDESFATVGPITPPAQTTYTYAPFGTDSGQYAIVANATQWYSEFHNPPETVGNVFAFNGNSDPTKQGALIEYGFKATKGDVFSGLFTAASAYCPTCGETPDVHAWLSINGSSLELGHQKLTGSWMDTLWNDVTAWETGDALLVLTLSTFNFDANDGLLSRIQLWKSEPEIPIDPTPVPEPTSLVMLGSSLLLGAVAIRRRLFPTA